MFGSVFVIYSIMQVIVLCNFMIAIVSDTFETDYNDVLYFH